MPEESAKGKRYFRFYPEPKVCMIEMMHINEEDRLYDKILGYVMFDKQEIRDLIKKLSDIEARLEF